LGLAYSSEVQSIVRAGSMAVCRQRERERERERERDRERERETPTPVPHFLQQGHSYSNMAIPNPFK